MANYCDFTMAIVGKKENIDQFVNAMTYDYDKPYFYVIYEYSIDEQHEKEDGEYVEILSGYCAWSVYSSMFPGAGTYYNMMKGDDTNVTNILTETNKLNLTVEIYSTEPGCQFAEHFVVRNGNVICNEVEKYAEYDINELDIEYYGDFEKAAKECGIPSYVTRDMFDEYGRYTEGGFDDEFTII